MNESTVAIITLIVLGLLACTVVAIVPSIFRLDSVVEKMDGRIEALEYDLANRGVHHAYCEKYGRKK